MIICQWCGKMISYIQPKVKLGTGIYDHLECNQKRWFHRGIKNPQTTLKEAKE